MIYFRTKEEAEQYREEFFNLFMNAHTNRVLLGDFEDYDADGFLIISKNEMYDPKKNKIYINYVSEELPDSLYIPDWGDSVSFFFRGIDLAPGEYKRYEYMDSGEETIGLQIVSSVLRLGNASGLSYSYLRPHMYIDTYTKLNVSGSDLTFLMELNSTDREYYVVNQIFSLEKESFLDVLPQLIRLPRSKTEYADNSIPESINLYMPFYYLHPLVRVFSKHMVRFADEFVNQEYKCKTKFNLYIYRDVDNVADMLLKSRSVFIPEGIGDRLTVNDLENILKMVQRYPYGMNYHRMDTNNYAMTILDKIPMRVQLID